MRVDHCAVLHRQPNKRLQRFIGFFLLTFAMTTRAQEPKSTPAKSARPKAVGRPRKATLSELYEMFFKFAVHVEATADEKSKQGQDVSFYRDHLRKASGLRAVEYDLVVQAAQRFAAVDAEVRTQIKDDAAAFRQSQALRSVTKDQLAGHRSKLKSLMDQKSSSLATEIANVRQVLGEERAKAFESYLATKYVMKPRGAGPPLSSDPTSLSNDSTLKGGKSKVISETRGIDSGDSCEDFILDTEDGVSDSVSICTDAQISYLGSPQSNLVQFYASMSGTYYDPLGLGVDIWDTYVGGYFLINGMDATNGALDCDLIEKNSDTCSVDAQLDSPNGTTYGWYSVGVVWYDWDYSCTDEDGDPAPCYEDGSSSQSETESVTIYAPDISGLSQYTFAPGSNSTFTISGEYLMSWFENPPTVTVANQSNLFSGFTATPPESYPDGDIEVEYTVKSNASAGNYVLTVNNGFFSDSSFDLTIPEASTITGIAVNGVANAPLQADTTQTVTLTGTSFGTSTPSVSVNLDAAYVTAGAVSAHSNTSVTFSVATALNAPSGSVGFQLSTTNGTADSPIIPVLPITLPAPQIMMATSAAAQQSCTGVTEIDGPITTPVYAGQAMLLCAPAPNLPPGVTVTSWYWMPQNIADLTGGYFPSAASGGESPNPIMTGTTSGPNPLSFYWVNPDSTEAMTYLYCTNTNAGNAGNGCAQATASFDIDGPTGNLLPTASLQTNNSATKVLNAQGNPATLKMTNSPQQNTVGVTFTDGALLPTNGSGQPIGQFIWVQIIQYTTFSFLIPTTSTWTPPSNNGVGLDGVYPYPVASSNSTNDSPGVTLLGGLGEGAESFNAVMYVFWDPAIPFSGQTSCTPATTIFNPQLGIYQSTQSSCSSIPVPLGSVQWAWSACAINALAPTAGGGAVSPSWSVQCGPAESSAPAASGYPKWTTCVTSDLGACQ
jgi:hypothetical protein